MLLSLETTVHGRILICAYITKLKSIISMKSADGSGPTLQMSFQYFHMLGVQQMK